MNGVSNEEKCSQSNNCDYLNKHDRHLVGCVTLVLFIYITTFSLTPYVASHLDLIQHLKLCLIRDRSKKLPPDIFDRFWKDLVFYLKTET